MDPDTVCNICDEALEGATSQVDNVGERGLKSLIAKSKKVGDGKWEVWSTSTAVLVHNACRKWYLTATVKRAAEGARKSKTSSTSSGATLSTSASLSEPAPARNEFNFRDYCFICTNRWDRFHKRGCVVQHEHIKDKLLDLAEHREDTTSIDLIHRLKDVESLVAVGARYHIKCMKAFCNTPTNPSDLPPKAKEMDSAFQLITKHIKDSQKGKFTIAELLHLTGSRCFTTKVLYRKLMETFGEDIYILQQRGRETLILYKCFSMNKLCGDWYRDPHSLDQRQQEAIINCAAEIVRKDIESHEYQNDSYQPAGQFLHSVQRDIPPLLRAFIDKLIAPNSLENVDDDEERYFVQRSAIAHSIVALVRRSGFTSHLQLALGIYVHRKCGSKLIIDVLNKLGFCVSYYQLQQYEASVIMDPPKFVAGDKVCVQHVFGNTDHNVGTLDVYNTYHCLGGIAVYTPEEKISYEGRTKKLKSVSKISAAAIASQSIVRTVPWTGRSNGLENIKYDDTSKLFFIDSPVLPATYSTYLWAKHCDVQNVPSWRGFMEVLTADKIYNLSKVVCLPFINQRPSNMSTINTALRTALAEARRVNQKTCFVTFDQPLYDKARAIVAASQDTLKDVVVRFGGFHLLVSYLGSIGHIMNGSGIEDIWALTYAPASVKKMLAGHAYARAMRAHILTFTALGVMVCREIGGEIRQQYDQDVKAFLQSWDTEPPSIGDCQAEPSISKMTTDLIGQLAILKNRGPTAQLWVQYFECVVIALQFLEAERSGNWKLHLQSIRKMLPIFHAAGHFNYAKSVQIYLQDMVNIELTMTDDEYRRFTTEGNFTVRRSDKAWCGMWTDMTIQETLNRFFGTDMKHGRGVPPSAIARFLSAMPSSFSIIESFENYCGIASSTIEQHVDLASHRTKKDDDDIKKFILWFEEHRPFEPRAVLHSLSTGIAGKVATDCHLAFEKGKKSMESMVGQSVDKVSLSAVTSKVKNLGAAQMQTRVNNDTCSIDSALSTTTLSTSLLFQRISLLFHGDEVQTRKAFEFELSPYPLSLFDEFGLMRKTPESELSKIFEPYALQAQTPIRNTTFVIDGGFLLHNVCWPHGTSFHVICELYLSHIINEYGENSSVVFDGYSDEYNGPKSYERYRRRQQNMAPDVEFNESTLFTISQKTFLSNVKNKMKLVQMLSRYLYSRGLYVKVAQEDADALIARTAIDVKRNTGREVAVVSNNIDLLVLLIGLSDSSPLYFHNITPSGESDTLYYTENLEHLKSYILFAHAFAGCDTTSAIYGKGKKNLISILQKNNHLPTAVKTFYNAASTVESLCECGEQIIAHLYSFENPNQSLGDARYEKFSSLAVHTNVEIRLAALPPTRPVLREHAKRTFYQVQSWLGNNLDARDWGWKRTTTMMVPVINTTGLAPDNLLKMVQCACAGDCNNVQCNCRKNGLLCTPLCKHCGGQSCSNFSICTVENSEELSAEGRDEDNRTNEFLDIVEELNPENFGEENEDNMEIEYPFGVM